MPYSGGNFSFLVNSWNPAVSGQPIDPNAWNNTKDDLATGLSTAILKDGSQTMTAVIPFALGLSTNNIYERSSGSGVDIDGVLNKDGRVDTNRSTDVASATSTDIWAVTGNLVHITGTTTITSFGTASKAGLFRFIEFDGALTLTHGANLDLPGDANITTAAGDRCIVYANSTSAAVVLNYQPAAIGPSNIAYTNAANSFTALQNFTAGTLLSSTDAGATVGPTAESYRNSMSPAANDLIGAYDFTGNDLGANKVTYATFGAVIEAATNGTASGYAYLNSLRAGAVVAEWTSGGITGGTAFGSATGGRKGAGTVNAVSYYQGGAQIQGAKAWVTFNGTGTPAIIDSFNVTSITDNGTGEYTINFTNAMPNNTYAITGAVSPTTASGLAAIGITTPATGSVRISTVQSGTGLFDPTRVCVVIHAN